MYSLIIAEDDKWCREGLANIDWKKYNVHLAGVFEDGLSAYNYHKKNPCDLIITDIQMPNLNGIDFLKKAKKINDKTLFIVISAYTEFEYAHQAIELGVASYVVKPFSEEMILGKVVEALTKLNAVDETIDKNIMFANLSENKVNSTSQFIDYLAEHNAPSNKIILVCVENKTTEENENIYNFIDEDFVFKYMGANYVLYFANNSESSYSLKNNLRKIEGDVINFLSKVHNTENVQEALKDIKKLKNYYYFNPANLLDYKETQDVLKSDSKHIYVDYFKVINAINTNDVKSLQQCFKNIAEDIKKTNIDKSDMLLQYESLIKTLTSNNEKINLCDSIDCVKPLKDFKTFADLNTYIFELCLEFMHIKHTTQDLPVKVLEAIDFITNNYNDKDLSLQSVCDAIDYSYSNLSRDFHKSVNKTFKEYLTEFRLMKAKSLLENSSYRINEIAALVGLSQKNFNRIFVKYEKVTPTEYRRIRYYKFR